MRMERVPCLGTENSLMETFRENRIIMVELIDAPETRAFIETCRTTKGLLKVHRFDRYTWCKFETPDEACRFAYHVHRAVRGRPKPKAQGVCLSAGCTFEKLMGNINLFLSKRGHVKKFVPFEEPPIKTEEDQ